MMKRVMLAILIGMPALGGSYAYSATVAPSDVLGFEVAADWTSATVTPSLSTQHTEGSSSLAVKSVGYTVVKSVPFSISSPLGAAISLDLFLPTPQPNPQWFGAVQLYVDCPSKQVFNSFVGQVELSGLTVQAFNSLSFPVSQSIQSSIGSSCSNLDLSIAINIPSNASGTILLDDIQGIGETTTAPIPSDSRSRTFYMVPDQSVPAALGTTVSTYQIQEWPFENTVDVKATIGTQSFEAVSTVNNGLPTVPTGGPTNISYWVRLQDLIVYGQHEVDVISDSTVNGQHVQVYRVFSLVNALNAGKPAGFDAGAVTLTYTNGTLTTGAVIAQRSTKPKYRRVPASFEIPRFVAYDASRILLAGFWSKVAAPFKAVAHAASTVYNDVSHADAGAWAEYIGASIVAGFACYECAGAIAATIGTSGGAAPTLPVCGACVGSLVLEFGAGYNLTKNGDEAQSQDDFIIQNPICTRCLTSPPTAVCFCDSGLKNIGVNGQCDCVPE